MPKNGVYIANLSQEVDENSLIELFFQVGNVVNVVLPRDIVSRLHHGYGFITMKSEIEAAYACKVLNGIKICGQSLIAKPTEAEKPSESGVAGPGAVVFVGGLTSVKQRKDVFELLSQFGTLLNISEITMRNGSGSCFATYKSFEEADKAIEYKAFLGGKRINICYAWRPGTKQPHGTEVERIINALSVEAGSRK